MAKTQLIEADTGRVVLANIELADTFWKRFKGLQCRKSLPQGVGLMLAPCSSLHTCFMRFSIDVLMLDQDLLVTGIHRNIRPWRVALCKRGTTCVVETNVGEIDIPQGTRLRVET